MPLPAELDRQIRKRFEELLSQSVSIIKDMEQDIKVAPSDSSSKPLEECHRQDVAYHEFVTKSITLIELILHQTERLRELKDTFNALPSTPSSMKKMLGTLKGLRTDYDNGLLRSPYQIEASVAADYMKMADELLGEGNAKLHGHVPAAVLAGAVLEDALRRLCQRQNPAIATHKPNGTAKTLDPLIADLVKVKVFDKAKADSLKAWAKTRNYAAHGEFTKFTRQDVELMIQGILNFLADYL